MHFISRAIMAEFWIFSNALHRSCGRLCLAVTRKAEEAGGPSSVVAEAEELRRQEGAEAVMLTTVPGLLLSDCPDPVLRSTADTARHNWPEFSSRRSPGVVA